MLQKVRAGCTLISDTRNENLPPKGYYEIGGKAVYRELKLADVIGVPTSQIYLTLETIVPWTDTSAGPITQIATIGEHEWRRYSTTNTSWSAWIKTI